MHITSFISRFNKQSKRTLIVCGSTMSNYTPIDLYGDGVPQWHMHEDNNMLGMLLTDPRREALENKAAWAKIEKDWQKTNVQGMVAKRHGQRRPWQRLLGKRLMMEWQPNLQMATFPLQNLHAMKRKSRK